MFKYNQDVVHISICMKLFLDKSFLAVLFCIICFCAFIELFNFTDDHMLDM